MTGFVQVMTAVGNQDHAQQIARALVEQRLAGCVQVIGPVSSTYWWNDQVESAEEYLCLIKTRADLFDRLAAAIRAVHPYDVPEILAMPVTAGSASYLDWLNREIRPPGGSR
jgi:periplasmic divalent cation tolerance protein